MQKRLAALPATSASHALAETGPLQAASPGHAEGPQAAGRSGALHDTDTLSAAPHPDPLAAAQDTALSGPDDAGDAAMAAKSEDMGMTLGGATAHPVGIGSGESPRPGPDRVPDEDGVAAIAASPPAPPVPEVTVDARPAESSRAHDPVVEPPPSSEDEPQDTQPPPDTETNVDAPQAGSAPPVSPEASPPVARVHCDLVDLPGAGPGLVWLLQECGVASMAELATADAVELNEKLGLVGQLLDLDQWIAHARSRS